MRMRLGDLEDRITSYKSRFNISNNSEIFVKIIKGKEYISILDDDFELLIRIDEKNMIKHRE